MHKISPLILIALLLFSCETKKKDKYPTKDNKVYHNTINEQIKDFKHNGTYINPLVIYSFFPWDSDRFAYWNEINLTASDNANRFYIDGSLTISISELHKQPEIVYKPRNAEKLNDEDFDLASFDAEFRSFSYVYLGRLSNGVELIEYTMVSTGTLTANGLMGFSFNERKVAGDSSKHIFMRVEKTYGLQQVCKFELDKENNRVLVQPIDNMLQADFSDMPKSKFYVNFPKEATEALKESLKD